MIVSKGIYVLQNGSWVDLATTKINSAGSWQDGNYARILATDGNYYGTPNKLASSVASFTFPKTSGSASFTVSDNYFRQYTIGLFDAYPVGWVTLSGANIAPDGKSATYTLNYNSNTGMTRTARVSIASTLGDNKVVDLPISQAPADYVSISPTQIFPTAASGVEFDIAVSSSGTWSTSSSQPWILISPTSGNDGDDCFINVDINPSSSTRTGTVTFTSGTANTVLSVSQAGVLPYLTVPSSVSKYYADSATQSFNVSSSSSWTSQIIYNSGYAGTFGIGNTTGAAGTTKQYWYGMTPPAQTAAVGVIRITNADGITKDVTVSIVR